MTQISHMLSIAIFLSALLLLSTSTTARILQTNQGDEGVKANVISNKDLPIKTQEDSIYNALMGLEECAEDDESCLKRRIVEEAHLDYIYTQNHKP